MSVVIESSCDLRIGTSGYDYTEWEGVFYPKGIGRNEYLSTYSETFDTLELNFSYYGMPKAAQMKSILSRTRKPIDFAIKAHQSITHKINPSTWSTDVLEFITGVAPLAEADRLCAILLEFPYSFHYRPEERRYLDKVLHAFGSYPIVVEFRNAEWITARVIDELKKRNVALCTLDMPRLEGLPPESDLVTADLAYVRFHGRNSETWWTGDAGTRYEYLYSKEELSSWVPRIERMSIQTKRLRVFFNNHRRGDAAINARGLISLLTSAKLL
jgi:uncharacterized protein YecE (DUF72 family)